MNWTRSETLALAQQSCTICYGLGLRPGRGGAEPPCNCVFRAIFRACHERFRKCAASPRFSAAYYSEAQSARNRRHQTYGFRNEEYLADFILVSKRVLGEDTPAYRLFQYHLLLGADWKLCTRKLGMNRGEFFHEIYRIQQKLGRAFRELEPHALFPVAEYFGGVVRGCKRASAPSVPATSEMPTAMGPYNPPM